MEFLTTPTERFENLPGYNFSANYLDIEDGLIMHYVDEGPKDGAIVLLLHGEPSWSYLYRKMIPVFVENGYRTIAPDLIGFGKSSKPVNQSDYTYAKHVDWAKRFLMKLDLQNINLFCQDWGGLIGLRLVAEEGDRFDRVVAANTFLPTGDIPPSEAFVQWQQFSKTVPEFPVGSVLQMATTSDLPKEIIAAYDAPFPDESYKAGARVFPSLVPTSPDDPEAPANRAAWKSLQQFTKPFLTLFSDQDPITSGAEKYLQKLIPGAEGQAHSIIEGGGHFLQEDKGKEIAELMVNFMNIT